MESGSDDNFDQDHLLAWKLCKDYLDGDWKRVSVEDFQTQRLR